MAMTDDPATTHDGTDEKPKLVTFWSVGWIFLIMTIIIVSILARHGFHAYQQYVHQGGAAPHRLHTNGFDLEKTALPADLVRPINPLRAIDAPPTFVYEEIVDSSWGSKFLLPTDRVIGVTFNGQSRAYPQRVLCWHEVINDVVGGVPIAVTYNGPTDAAAVYSRRLGDETLALRHSGLVFNSGQILYDERDEWTEQSLWCQLRGEFVSGPRLGQRLELLPSQYVHLGDWLERHPESTLVPGRPSLAKKLYRRETYQAYYFKGQIAEGLPVSPLPKDPSKNFDQVLVVGSGENAKVFFHDEVKEKVDAQGAWVTEWNHQPIRLIYNQGPRLQPSCLVAETLDGELLPTRSALWFAWYSQINAELDLPATR